MKTFEDILTYCLIGLVGLCLVIFMVAFSFLALFLPDDKEQALLQIRNASDSKIHIHEVLLNEVLLNEAPLTSYSQPGDKAPPQSNNFTLESIKNKGTKTPFSKILWFKSNLLKKEANMVTVLFKKPDAAETESQTCIVDFALPKGDTAHYWYGGLRLTNDKCESFETDLYF